MPGPQAVCEMEEDYNISALNPTKGFRVYRVQGVGSP